MTWREAAERRRAAEAECAAIHAALEDARYRLALAIRVESDAALDWDGSTETAPDERC